MTPGAAVRARRWLPALALGLACQAHAAGSIDAQGWLKRAVQASRNVSYAGTFVHTNGDRISTIRVTHVMNGGDEHERIEALDGSPYEIVRRNEEMFCYFPDAKTVRLDRRVNARFFPSLFRASADVIAASYDVRLGKTERVLGYECQWLRLEPRDAQRYSQAVCAEVGTGLVVRAKTYNEQKQVIEQYTFTELRMGPQAARNDLRSLFRARNRQWISDGQPRDEAIATDSGWIVQKLPVGFQKIAELKRSLPGRPSPVAQLVYTDGLATLSVFVEPNATPPRAAEAGSEDGTTTFFVRPIGEHVVSVLGEVPPATAQQVARSVQRRP